MFKKNVYAFSALLALSCSAYAMEGRDDLSSSAEKKGGRIALRSSSASWSAPEPEANRSSPAAVLGESVDQIFEPFPLEFDFSAPASSTQSSLFPDDNAKVTFTLLALRQAGSHDNPIRDPRAEALYLFLQEAFHHHQLDWDSTVVHKLPILASELNSPDLWDMFNDSKDRKKIGVALGVYPKRQEVIDRLGEALGEYSREYPNRHKRDVGLRKMALRAANRITELETELKAFKAEAAELRTSFETERAVRWFKERCPSRK
jgi:hypothetical protein